jgi:pimeloyl-ACP methyl ester carboxylesterase
VDEPVTRYAKSGDVHIAYQTLGDGPYDLVYAPGFVSNLELGWQAPSRDLFLRRLASFSRLILFDKRGTGLSDRVSGAPTLEARIDDLRAVLDAVGSQRTALFGVHEGGSMALLFAATHPERTFALVINGASVRGLWAFDYPWAPTTDEYLRELDEIDRRWGSPEHCDELLRRIAPSMTGDEAFRRWWGSYLRQSASPATALALHRMNMDIDLRHVLPAIRVPTLILAREGEPPDMLRYLESAIPSARLSSCPGWISRRTPGTSSRPSARSSRSSAAPGRSAPGRTWRRTASSSPCCSPHRRVDHACSRARRQRVARAAGCARRDHAPPARPLRRQGDQDGRRRVPRHVRRSGARHQVRVRDPRRRARRRARDQGRPPYRRVRAHQRGRARNRGQHRRPRRSARRRR